ncbi:MAG: hypothetical protein CM15mP7_1610 [Pelagibacteraceae bacterium]|nr:MAG: hypothetical protein CM15mP7_1610 [Pelagibacteraceae bacterium]
MHAQLMMELLQKGSGDGADFIDDGCDSTPIHIRIIYKLYLCTSVPKEATTTSAVANAMFTSFFISSGQLRL